MANKRDPESGSERPAPLRAAVKQVGKRPNTVREKQIDALVSMRVDGTTKAECARQLRVDVRTVSRWLDDDAVFKRIDTEAEDRYNFHAARRLDLASSAVPVLLELMADQDPRIRLRAVELVYARGTRDLELTAMARDLAAIRATLPSKDSGWDGIERNG